MESQTPKAVKAEMASTILKIEFDNGQTKYLRSNLNKVLTESFSLKKGTKRNMLLTPHAVWLGANVEIKKDGTVVVNDTDEYSPEELWNNSKNHIHEL
ncbi:MULTISPECIES: hypothetical protein [unclassified Enterococcus]|jgi:DUF971 family protein|uniref:hypothetical protein n=1 Tax=unclassified Enterococcus TaxID=2608891 RepID=UPI003D283636